MECTKVLDRWVDVIGEEVRESFKGKQVEEVEDAFCKSLKFGTAGIRGKLGYGPNRLNIYAINQTIQGYANYLLDKVGKYSSVVISYDNRHMSKEFAGLAADCLTNNGIKVYLCSEIRSTPQLSFFVRHFKASGGIMITASHNPKEYNGCKLYNNQGNQLIPEEADEVIEYINRLPDMLELSLPPEYNGELITYLDDSFDEAYYNVVESVNLRTDVDYSNVSVVFTPQHGASYKAISELLTRQGANLILVDSQCRPDPDFTNTKSANPEDLAAYEEALKLAKVNNADFIISTDPDGDRLGVMVLCEDNEYKLLTGNQLATIMINYMVKAMKELNTMPGRPYIVSTTVSSPLPCVIASKHNIDVDLVHTGFKYIGQLINHYETTDKDKKFIFGFEESYGCLIYDEVRDKDAVQASRLVTEIVAYYKNTYNKNLIDILNDIYKEHGFFYDNLINIVLPNPSDLAKITKVMEGIRTNPPSSVAGNQVKLFEDFMSSESSLEPANVIKIHFDDGSFVAFRPSGTEPKFKIYFSICSDSEAMAKEKLELIYNDLKIKYLSGIA